MKKLILVLLVIAVGSVLAAQNNIFSPGFTDLSNSSSSLLNPFKLKMRHSAGFSAGSSSTGAGFYESRYTNHLSYEFNPKLNLELDLNFVNYGSTTMKKSFDISSNDDNKSRVLPEFSLTYKPTDNIIMQVEYRTCAILIPGRTEIWLGWDSSLDPFILALLIVLGTSLGSFFNVCIDRLPRKESLVKPRSHCTNCGKAVPFYLNVPILSYILLRGKCKYCQAVIPWHHLIVEIVTPIVFIALFWRFQDNLILFGKYSLLCAFLIPIFFIDLYHRLILDKLTIPLAITGIAIAFLPGSDIRILNSVLTGLGILALLLFIAWAFEKIRKVDGMGGGDIGCLAAMATFVGAINISFIILFASILAVLVSAVSPLARKTGIPYGPFLAVTTFAWLLAGNYFIEWYFGMIMNF